MAYCLGIDLGTTSTAAAVLRDGGAHPETVALGGRLAVIPSVAYRGSDGTVLVGESAERRAGDEPDRVVREVKRRLGDDVPPVVGGEPWPAEDVAAAIVAWVLARVEEREGGPARRVVVTRPATWGDFRCDRLRHALAAAGLPEVELLAEPHAAVLGHAALRRPAVVGGRAPEEAVTTAVYDLGGGTFDAAVARREPDGTITLLGTPRGLDRLGGVDFDEAVLAHVRAEVADDLAALDPGDPETWHSLHRLRRECVEAKEALSADTEVTVPVVLPAGRRSVRLGRADFEAGIRGAVAVTVEEFLATLADADVEPGEVDHVLLAGGSSTIPLVARMLTEALGRPVSADADPLTVVALGAAMAAAGGAGADDEPAPVRGPQRPPTTVVGLFDERADEEDDEDEGPDDEPADPPRRGRRRVVAASVVLAAVVAVAVSVPLPLNDAVTDSVRGVLRDVVGAPGVALPGPTQAPRPTAPPTVVARPLSAAAPLAAVDATAPAGAASPALPAVGPALAAPPADGVVPAAVVPAAGPAPSGATVAATPASAPTSDASPAPTGPSTPVPTAEPTADPTVDPSPSPEPAEEIRAEEETAPPAGEPAGAPTGVPAAEPVAEPVEAAEPAPAVPTSNAPAPEETAT